MGTGAVTQYIDLAQIVLYVFWIFFFWSAFVMLSEKPPFKTKIPLCCTVDLNINFLGRKILFISLARIPASFVVNVLPALGSITFPRPLSNLS